MVESATEKRTTHQFAYQRHEPQESVLYKVVQNNWLTFQAQMEKETGQTLPSFVVKEFEEYLRCGILAHGFLRVKCMGCHHEHLVAFSCKRRGFCPSCGARRMSETAAHLVDEVLPVQNIRQWVLSFPLPLRFLLSARPKIMTRALDITQSTISAYYRSKAQLIKAQSKTGSVTLIQRFGGSLNLNVHFHMLFLDGSYEVSESATFHPTPAPSKEELTQVLDKIIKRLVRYLERQKVITRDEDSALQLSLDGIDGFSKLQSSSVSYRFALGPNKGKKAIVIKSVQQDNDHGSDKGLVAKSSGFSLHAGVATKALERARLEKLCRYIARPAVAEGRLSLNCRGEVVYLLKKPWADGTTAIKMTQMEFMERLAALVPRPRVNLTRYHGVLAPHDKYRKFIIPKKQSPPTPETAAEIDPDFPKDATVDHSIPSPGETDQPKRKNMTWARLLLFS